MSNTHWYPHYIGDYNKDTSHLSMVEHGAYRLLMDHYYATKQALPANAEQLHRICTAFADDEKKAIESVLSQFFAIGDDGYHNKRADDLIARMRAISGKRRKAAKSKAQKHHANALQVQSKWGANDPITTATTTTTSKATPEGGGAEGGFRDLISVV
jgi:uncharacterized protein YdaU (DUF1376 family)